MLKFQLPTFKYKKVRKNVGHRVDKVGKDRTKLEKTKQMETKLKKLETNETSWKKMKRCEQNEKV